MSELRSDLLSVLIKSLPWILCICLSVDLKYTISGLCIWNSACFEMADRFGPINSYFTGSSWKIRKWLEIHSMLLSKILCHFSKWQCAFWISWLLVQLYRSNHFLKSKIVSLLMLFNIVVVKHSISICSKHAVCLILSKNFLIVDELTVRPHQIRVCLNRGSVGSSLKASRPQLV